MKKFILLIILMSFICPSTNAIYIVDEPTNGTIQVARKRQTQTPIQYGQVGTMKNRRFKTSANASRPSRCCAKPIARHNSEYYKKMARYRMEQRKLHMRRIPCQDLGRITNLNQKPSRFDKNYNISSKQRTISCGGVTYYGTSNPCK